jgi:triosephosphate isomerase
MTYLVANWKMNFTLPEAVAYATNLEARYEPVDALQVILAPTTFFLYPLSVNLAQRKLSLAAQTLAAPDFGAFTGETSAAQLANFVQYTILGHSERRQYFSETDDDIAEKAKFALDHQIIPIICVGETAAEREAGKTLEVLSTQLTAALSSIDVSRVIVAYEPVWAISSTPGAQQATPETIAVTVAEIQRIISQLAPTQPPLLYGGSVNPDNLAAYLQLDSISGALIGNASLDIEKMYAMIEIAKKVAL